MADPKGIPTKEQEKSMNEMRRCQRMAGWYGLWSSVLTGAVSFGGLMFFPREMVPKMYIPMISLGCATCCGWGVSMWFTKSCRSNQLQRIHSRNLANDQHSETQSVSHQNEGNDIRIMSNKFGDEAFYKEDQ